jgi:hypothetical protein
MIFIVKNDCSGFKNISRHRGSSDIYGDGCTNEQYCLNIEELNTIQFKSCSGHYTRWLYDDYRMYIMDTEQRRCLTVVKEKIFLLPCEMEPHSTKQMWKFENKNTESTFVQTFPNMTIEDWEFGLEFQSKPAEKIRNIKSIFNWGQLMNGDKQSCLMHDSTSTTNGVVFKYCKISTDLQFEYTTHYTMVVRNLFASMKPFFKIHNFMYFDILRNRSEI